MALIDIVIPVPDADGNPRDQVFQQDTDTGRVRPKFIGTISGGGGGGLSGDRLINMANPPYDTPTIDLTALDPVLRTVIGNYSGPSDDVTVDLPDSGGRAFFVGVAGLDANSVTFSVAGTPLAFASTEPVALYADEVEFVVVPDPTSDWVAFTVYPFHDDDVRSDGSGAAVITGSTVNERFSTADAALNSQANRIGTLETPTVATGLSTSGTVNLDLSTLNGTVQWITATGALTFTTSNLAAGRSLRLFIDAGGSSRTLSWPSWIAHGTALPTSLASGKRLAVSIMSLGTTDANVSAAAAVQP